MRRHLFFPAVAAALVTLAPATAAAQLGGVVGGVTGTVGTVTGTVGTVTGGETESVTGVVEGLAGQLTDPAGNLVGTVNGLTGQVLDPTGVVIGLLGPGGQIVPVAPGTVPPILAPTPQGGSGGTSGGQQPAIDRVAPIVRVIARSASSTRVVVRRGIRGQVRCSEACAVLTSLELDARSARRLGVGRGRRPLVLASRPVVVSAGNRNTPVTLKPTRRARRALARHGRTVRLRLRAVAFDAHANRSGIVSRRVAVRP